AQKKEALFRAQASDTEMKALRAQMNPHFIFNSLNSINDYIDKTDTVTATRYTTKFAKLMRLILEHSGQKQIPLADELQALELYLQLEALRLHHAFSYEIKIDRDIDPSNTLIPSLLLQPFVENSIWHGLSKRPSGGKISIEAVKEGDMLCCIVEDNGIGRDASARQQDTRPGGKTALGMKLTQARIDIINREKQSRAGVQVTDLNPGTRVELRIALELSF
ncbi:MAG: histidine kinase, partial [Bacteroidetes bacterium]|nr:histidine kinase [Bacteroidota bacterium]